jgi:hypothetical protein
VLDHQVLRTIAVGRHVLLLAEVAADSGSGLVGRVIAQVHQPGLLRVIAMRRASPAGGGSSSVDWSPPPGYLIQPGDQIVVLATRTGLSGLLRRDASPAQTAAPVGTSGKQLSTPENGSP